MLTITLDNAQYQCPQQWAEVEPEHLPRLLTLVYFQPETGPATLELIRTVLQIPGKRWRKLMQAHFAHELPEATRTANAVVLVDFLRHLDWMRTEPIFKKPFVDIQHGGHSYLLPEEGFVTMSFGELTDAYIHFLTFTQQLVPGEEHLNLLVSTLCRPRQKRGYTTRPGWDGDHREAYNEYSAKDRAGQMAMVPAEVRMAVLLFFAGNLKKLLEQYKVFGGGSGEADAYPGQGMMKNQHLLAEKGVFGNISQTKAANAHEVLLFLEEHRADVLAQQEADRKSHD